MTTQFEKLVDEAAQDAAKDKPVELGAAIRRLDSHLSGQSTEIWLAWCSVRQTLRRALESQAIS